MGSFPQLARYEGREWEGGGVYLSARRSTQKPQGQRVIRLRRIGRRIRRKKISGQLCASGAIFLSFFFFHRPPFFPSPSPARVPDSARRSSSFYCFSRRRRRKTVANRIRGPLFTRSPATLCLCFSPISVAPSPLLSHSISLFLPLSLCLASLSFLRSFLRLLLVSPAKPSYQREFFATYNPLLSGRDRVLIAATAANRTSRKSVLRHGLSAIYRSLVPRLL